jgi:hypothetical protein
MSVFSAIEGSLKIQGTVSGTDATAVRLDEPTHALKVYLTNPACPTIIFENVTPNTLVGTDGITIISGSNFTTIQGFRPEFVAASGFLQTQIDAVEGSDVDSINALTGSVLVTGTQNVTTQTVGQTITITGPDLSSYATTAYVDSVVDEVEPAIISANSLIVITSGSNTTTLTADTTPSFTSVDASTGTFSTSLTISGLPVTAGAGGSNTQVQFNDAGSLGGDSGLVYNKTTDTLTTVTITGTTGQFGGAISAQNLSITSTKTLTATNSLTVSGTDSTTMTFPPASASIGYINIPQNSRSAAYTTVLADAGKHIYHPVGDAVNRIFTIDSNANVAYAVGTTITFINRSPNNVTISITSDTLTWSPTGATGSRTLPQYGVATATKIVTTEWIITGVGLS